MMHGREKSDPVIVAVKSPNKTGEPAAEAMERRAGAEENASQQRTRRTQSRESVSQTPERVRTAARFCRQYPRWEPDAGKPHVRFWGGTRVTRFPTAIATSPLPRVPAMVPSQSDLQTFTVVRCKPAVWSVGDLRPGKPPEVKPDRGADSARGSRCAANTEWRSSPPACRSCAVARRATPWGSAALAAPTRHPSDHSDNSRLPADKFDSTPPSTSLFAIKPSGSKARCFWVRL
jgi:hypothetical protein